MILTGLEKKKKRKRKDKKGAQQVKTRGDLMVEADLTKRLQSLDPLQVQVWIPNIKRTLRELVIQVTASEGLWKGIPFRIHARYPEKYTVEAPSFKLDPAWKIFHPNVSLEDNALCLGFTREWKPEYHLVFQCHMILSILSHLNERDPLNQPAGHMVIDDKEEGTTKFANLVKRTIRGGSVDVPINAEGEKSQVTFPSAIEMAILAKKVPAEWVDAREWAQGFATSGEKASTAGGATK